jgi:outer membrane protein assembly factor BamA
MSFLCFIVSIVDAQQNHNLSDYKVSFEGLTKTKEDFLLKLIEAESGNEAMSNSLDAQLNIIRNQTGIADASYSIDTVGSEHHLKYFVTERKTALPIVNFGGIRDNLWFSIGFIENNLRGGGDQLLTFYQNNNGRHSGQIFYKRPRTKNLNWGYSASLNRWASEEPLFFEEGTVNFLYDNTGAGVSLIRNIDLRQNLEFKVTVFREEYSKSENQPLDDPPGPDNFGLTKLLTGVSYYRNYINYKTFYPKGFDIILDLKNVRNFGESNFFNSFRLQARYFVRPPKRKKLNLAARFKGAISTNDDSPFAPFVADSHINIRGIGNRIDRGTAQAVLNLELRYTHMTREKYATQLVLFSDAGTWRDPGGNLSQLFEPASFNHFVGGGFRVIFPKIFGAIIRVDYGVNIYDTNARGLVLGLGQFF